jgi:hypothetical protein
VDDPVEYSASLDPLVSVLRVHRGPGGTFGDPWVWSCLVVREAGTTAHLMTTASRLTGEMTRAIGPALRAAGFDRCYYERVRADGTVRRYEHQL